MIFDSSIFLQVEGEANVCVVLLLCWLQVDALNFCCEICMQ
jgi:hypothetical protein